MVNLDGLKYGFDQYHQRSPDKNVFWTLKGDGRRIHVNLEFGSPADSWDMLERMIMDEAANGVRNFEITLKRSKTDGEGSVKRVKSSYSTANKLPGQGQQPGIFGIGEINRLQEQIRTAELAKIRAEHAAEIKAIKDEIKRGQELDQLRGEIYELKEGKKTALDQIIEKIEGSPKLMGLFEPFISGLAGSFFPKVTISGVPDATTVPPVASQNASTEEQGTQAEEARGGCDMNLLFSAASMMNNAGILNADEKLYVIAYVAALNPDFFTQNYAQIEAAYNQHISQQNQTEL